MPDQSVVSLPDLVTLQSPDDLLQRRNLVRDVPSSILRKLPYTFIASYEFGEPISCGLPDCRSPHQKGLLGVLKDGREFHVGHCCGRTKFGENFLSKRNELQKREREAVLRGRLADFLRRADWTVAEANGINDESAGGKWAYRALREWARAVPQSVRSRVKRMAAEGRPAVTEERQRSGREIEDLRAAGLIRGDRDRDHLVETKIVGQLVGLEVFNADIQAAYRTIRLAADEIKETNIERLTLTQLERWAKRIREVDEALETMKAVVAAARRFFVVDNFDLLHFIAPNDEDKRIVKQTGWDFRAPAAHLPPQRREKVAANW